MDTTQMVNVRVGRSIVQMPLSEVVARNAAGENDDEYDRTMKSFASLGIDPRRQEKDRKLRPVKRDPRAGLL